MKRIGASVPLDVAVLAPTWAAMATTRAWPSRLLPLAIDRWQTSGIIFKFGKESPRRM
jgi:hypothetical protein